MDARIGTAEDVKKLEHCEILEAESGTMGSAPCLKLVLRSLDETVFTLWLVSGYEQALVGGLMQLRPTLNFVTKEVLHETR